MQTLNSNLILLILLFFSSHIAAISRFKFQSDSINTWTEEEKPVYEDIFKFQSDSINTDIQAIQLNAPFALNSNLILLILNSNFIAYTSYAIFKFQSDSINTRVQRHL